MKPRGIKNIKLKVKIDLIYTQALLGCWEDKYRIESGKTKSFLLFFCFKNISENLQLVWMTYWCSQWSMMSKKIQISGEFCSLNFKIIFMLSLQNATSLKRNILINFFLNLWYFQYFKWVGKQYINISSTSILAKNILIYFFKIVSQTKEGMSQYLYCVKAATIFRYLTIHKIPTQQSVMSSLKWQWHWGWHSLFYASLVLFMSVWHKPWAKVT